MREIFQCRIQSCDDEYRHSCGYFLFNTSNHIFVPLETGPSLFFLDHLSSPPHQSRFTFLPHASRKLIFTRCLARSFRTDLILPQHVRYVLRCNLRCIGTCPAAVNQPFSLTVHELTSPLLHITAALSLA